MPDVVTLESVNTLDHRLEQESSEKKDLEERRQFLKKELNTENGTRNLKIHNINGIAWF